MRYEVPQFIEIEDKILGPFTFKQAVYLAGSFGLAFIVFQLLGYLPIKLPGILKVVLAVPFIGIGAAFAFVKVNKRPFVFYVEAALKYAFSSKKYVWKKSDKKISRRASIHKNEQTVTVDTRHVPDVTRSKIKDLAWSLDMGLKSDRKEF